MIYLVLALLYLVGVMLAPYGPSWAILAFIAVSVAIGWRVAVWASESR